MKRIVSAACVPVRHGGRHDLYTNPLIRLVSFFSIEF